MSSAKAIDERWTTAKLEEVKTLAKQYDKRLLPLVAERDKVDKVLKERQQRRHAIATQLAAFTAGEVDMTDADYMRAKQELELLDVRMRQTSQQYNDAQKVVNALESERSSRVINLAATAVLELDTEHRRQRDELLRAFRSM